MPTANQKKFEGFSADERAAMKARAKELVAEAKSNKNKAEGEKAAVEAIAAMSGSDRSMAQRLHTLIKASSPTLAAKTWYGMPAYAKDDKTICFFKCAAKFKARYATLGFSDAAKLDEGALWPVEFALKQLTAAEEAKITQLVKRAVS